MPNGPILALLVLLVALAPLVVTADNPPPTRWTDDGYCVLVSPADPPFVYVDPSHCDVPP